LSISSQSQPFDFSLLHLPLPVEKYCNDFTAENLNLNEKRSTFTPVVAPSPSSTKQHPEFRLTSDTSHLLHELLWEHVLLPILQRSCDSYLGSRRRSRMSHLPENVVSEVFAAAPVLFNEWMVSFSFETWESRTATKWFALFFFRSVNDGRLLRMK